MNKTFEKLLSMPKSLWVSFRFFPFKQAIKIPIMVRYNTSILEAKSKVIVNGKVKSRMIQIGFGNVGVFDKRFQRSILQLNGTIEFNGSGPFYFGHGSRLYVGENALLRIGQGFVNTAEMTLICDRKIEIGQDVTISWSTLIMDTDWHPVYDFSTGKSTEVSAPISIGNHVWIGTRAVVLKGSVLPNDCIVGACSLVRKPYDEPRTLIAGNPARVVKHNITVDKTNL